MNARLPNARLPNEWRNECPISGGISVGTGIYAAFGKDWVVPIALLLQSPSPYSLLERSGIIHA